MIELFCFLSDGEIQYFEIIEYSIRIILYLSSNEISFIFYWVININNININKTESITNTLTSHLFIECFKVILFLEQNRFLRFTKSGISWNSKSCNSKLLIILEWISWIIQSFKPRAEHNYFEDNYNDYEFDDCRRHCMLSAKIIGWHVSRTKYVNFTPNRLICKIRCKMRNCCLVWKQNAILELIYFVLHCVNSICGR